MTSKNSNKPNITKIRQKSSFLTNKLPIIPVNQQASASLNIPQRQKNLFHAKPCCKFLCENSTSISPNAELPAPPEK